jgi:hypothetical protein
MRRAFILLALLAAPLAHAQSLGPKLQDASIYGRDGTITIKRLPVRTPTGIVYRDITIQLQFDAAGELHVDAASKALPPGVKAALTATVAAPVPAHDLTIQSLTETATPPDTETPFLTGSYRSDSGALVRVVKVATIGSRFPTYSLIPVLGDLPLGGADWYAGPARTNPHARLMNIAGVDPNAYAYGTTEGSGAGAFDNGMLIGATQKGDQLTLVGFHLRGCCTYSATPTSQVSFTRTGH